MIKMVEECSEPNCRSPVTKEFNGLKLCSDCWKKYKEEERKSNQDLRDL